MARLLYIEASPHKERSVSVAAASVFLEAYRNANLGDIIDVMDIWSETLPQLDQAAYGRGF
jgi:FMN-dependent NADH-azoreductase